MTDVRDAIGMIFDGTPSIDTPNDESNAPPGPQRIFRVHLRELEVKRRALMAMRPVTRESVPKDIPDRGVYLFSELGQHLYVGRSNRIRRRIHLHGRPRAKHNMASFAFLLAKRQLVAGRAKYGKGQSRGDLANEEVFDKEFSAQKLRIRAMQLRYVEETDPVRQALLEIYVSVVHRTQFNDFDTH